MAAVDSAGISLTKVVLHGDLEQVHRLVEGMACDNEVDENGQTALMIVARRWWYKPERPEIAIALMNGGADVNMKDKEGNTALMHAIAQRNEDIALVIIEHSKDLDLNTVNNQGKTALMKAAFRGMTKVVLPLIQRGANVNMKDKEEKTALMCAIACLNENTALAIMENSKDLDLNAVDDQGQTTLIKAAFRGMTTFALELIKRGADVNIADKEGKTALMHAIAYPNENTALAIMENSKDLDLNAVDDQGKTALMKAAFSRGMTTFALALIKRGAEVNIKDKEGKTALMYAIAYPNENTALAIMENCKDLLLNAVDDQGRTGLIKAAIIRGMTRFVLALIKRGANVNMKDKEEKTALMYAIACLNENTALAIIENSKDLDLNAVDDQGQTALMKAALIRGMTAFSLALIKRGADVNIKDKEGKTALMYAIAYPNENTALAMIENSKDLNLNTVDNQGQTALIKAAISGMTTIADALIRLGTVVNIQDKEGKTALMHGLACANENTALAIMENCKDLNLNTVDNQGHTALMYATACANENTALFMIENCKDLNLNTVDNQSQTVLMKAAISGMTRFALALIKCGADVNIKDKEGNTALMYAIAYANENTALAMIENSKYLNLNTVDNQSQTVLMKAAISGMTRFALALIKCGADVNIKDKEGNTALMHAIDYANENTALGIIEQIKDLDLNAIDNQGQTALMMAAFRGMTTISNALITRGADVNMKDIKGRVALMYIGLADFDKAFRFDAGILTHKLINAGADVNKTDDDGNTALMYNVKYETSLIELIERGKAYVDVRDDQGRTALFYALVESNLSTRYLVENGANLHLIDKHNVSVLSYFIHHCINNGVPDENLMHEKFALLKYNGVKKETIVNALINAVFCKLPLLKSQVNTISITSITSCLAFATKLSKKRLSFRKDNKCRLLQDLVVSIKRDQHSVSVSYLSKRLDKLLEIDADPNTCDEQGNTIAHHITLLGIYDNSVEAKNVFDFLVCLEKKGLKINKKNCNKDLPLFFMLTKAVNHDERRLNKEFLLDMCIFFLEKDRTILQETSQTGDSVFHLLVKLSMNEESLERCTVELLRLFPHSRWELGSIVNSTNDEMNTPLHVWAAGSRRKSKAGERDQHASERLNLQRPSEKMLDLLFNCGALHHATNMKKETPLHMCRTWAAVKLLFKAGAKTNDVDALGRSPLLSAAENRLFLENPGCFYPDVSPDETPTFWKTVMDMGFDLWTCDKNGDSIIGILIKENSFMLASGLIEITCNNSRNLQNEILVGVLNAICKDESTQTTWKSILLDKLLKQLKFTRRSLDLSLPLRSCCMNVIDHCATIRCTEATEPDSVHYKNAKQLLRYGAPGESCLDFGEGCPPLQVLLSTPISIEERPLVIPWTSRSRKHKQQLAEVARGLNFNAVGQYCYHKTQIGRGAFAQVFVGIHKTDGMEVAVKRVHYIQKDRYEDIRKTRSLASLLECKHIVRYLTFLQTAGYFLIIMELMEGNLIEYFASNVYDQRQTKVLCRDLALGLKYLHEQNIIHCDIKPTKILYKTDPQLCLKIADFGLSRRIDVISSFTVKATGVGTRSWIAPEVLKSTAHEHSWSSDVFSCGLVFHYILSKGHRHPFSPTDCADKCEFEIILNTENNILNSDMKRWDSCLDPESSHLITGMLNCTNEKERPTASMLLHHPMFWSKKKKLDFLIAVGNQEEFECPRSKRTAPLTIVEKDLENEFATIVKFGKWDDPQYKQTSAILIEMQKPIVKHDKKGKPYTVPTRKYDIGSAVELVRFIRNAIAHVSEASRPPAIRTQILEDAVFLDEFPNLVIEVFKAVTTHGWDVSRKEIKHVLAND